MRRVIVVTAVLVSLALPARANDAPELSLKNKALVSAAVPVPAARQSDAPFVSAHDPLAQLLMLEEQDRRAVSGGTCEAAARDLCYDAASGRIVYRAARKYMPAFDGLTAESVSVRGNRVIFRYSFK